MKFVRNDISTFCYGQAASAAAVILAGGTKGKRYALPHGRILLHQPYGGAAGQAADIEIQAKEIIRMRDLLNEMIAIDTGQSLDKVVSDTDRDFIMSAAEAKDYGIIDEVITTASWPAYLPRPALPEHEERHGQVRRIERAGQVLILRKSQKQVKKLIAGPGVYICDECIDLCNDIIEEELSERRRCASTSCPSRPRSSTSSTTT